MRRELAIEFSRVTESAALAGYKWLGRGDKNTADGAAVNAMRIMLNQVNIDGTIVIGEGEIDEAPMLYIGEKVGTGRGDAVDIAVDPIEGTRMTAMGQANALAVLAVGDKGCFLNAPDMYMEKLIVGPGAKGTIDLNLPLADNLAVSGKDCGRLERLVNSCASYHVTKGLGIASGNHHQKKQYKNLSFHTKQLLIRKIINKIGQGERINKIYHECPYFA